MAPQNINDCPEKEDLLSLLQFGIDKECNETKEHVENKVNCTSIQRYTNKKLEEEKKEEYDDDDDDDEMARYLDFSKQINHFVGNNRNAYPPSPSPESKAQSYYDISTSKEQRVRNIEKENLESLPLHHCTESAEIIREQGRQLSSLLINPGLHATSVNVLEDTDRKKIAACTTDFHNLRVLEDPMINSCYLVENSNRIMSMQNNGGVVGENLSKNTFQNNLNSDNKHHNTDNNITNEMICRDSKGKNNKKDSCRGDEMTLDTLNNDVYNDVYSQSSDDADNSDFASFSSMDDDDFNNNILDPISIGIDDVIIGGINDNRVNTNVCSTCISSTSLSSMDDHHFDEEIANLSITQNIDITATEEDAHERRSNDRIRNSTENKTVNLCSQSTTFDDYKMSKIINDVSNQNGQDIEIENCDISVQMRATEKIFNDSAPNEDFVISDCINSKKRVDYTIHETCLNHKLGKESLCLTEKRHHPVEAKNNLKPRENLISLNRFDDASFTVNKEKPDVENVSTAIYKGPKQENVCNETIEPLHAKGIKEEITPEFASVIYEALVDEKINPASLEEDKHNFESVNNQISWNINHEAKKDERDHLSKDKTSTRRNSDGGLCEGDYPFFKGYKYKNHPGKLFLLNILRKLAPIYDKANTYEEFKYGEWIIPSRKDIRSDIITIMEKRPGKFKEMVEGAWVEVYDYEKRLNEFISNKFNEIIKKGRKDYSFETITQQINASRSGWINVSKKLSVSLLADVFSLTTGMSSTSSNLNIGKISLPKSNTLRHHELVQTETSKAIRDSTRGINEGRYSSLFGHSFTPVGQEDAFCQERKQCIKSVYGGKGGNDRYKYCRESGAAQMFQEDHQKQQEDISGIIDRDRNVVHSYKYDHLTRNENYNEEDNCGYDAVDNSGIHTPFVDRFVTNHNIQNSGIDSSTLLALGEDIYSIKQHRANYLLEQHLRHMNLTESYVKMNHGNFVIRYKDLEISISIRGGGGGVDIASTVYIIDKCSSSKERTTSYSLMTKMMKYKAIFHERDRREQVRIWNYSILYIQTLPLSSLYDQYYIKFMTEEFCKMAVKMNADFHELYCEKKALENIQGKYSYRRRSCY